MTDFILLAIVAWVASGFGFWIGCLVHNGAPQRWRSHPRTVGWDSLLLFYLPLSIGAGPIAWVVLAWARWAKGEQR